MKLLSMSLGALAAIAAAPVVAQQPNTTSVAYSIAPQYQGKADLDRGGDFSVTAVDVSLRVTTALSSSLQLGINGQVGFEDFSFDRASAFGALAPWDRIDRAVVGMPLTWLLSDGWRVTAAPQLEYAAEDGAQTSEAYGYGGFAAVSRTFSKDLTFGLGVGVYRRFSDNNVYPVVLVDWRIDERWRLSNPLPAGPAGPAGLELTYLVDPRWELGFGGAYRSFRFRLDKDGPTPDGIGEYRLVPVFARLSWRFMPEARLDFYVGAALGGELKLQSSGAQTLVKEDFDPAPIVAINLAGRF